MSLNNCALNNEKFEHIMVSAAICTEIRFVFGIGKKYGHTNEFA